MFVADAQVIVAIGFGQIGQHAHLVAGGIARRLAMGFDGHGDNGVLVVSVRGQVRVSPGAEGGVGLIKGVIGIWWAALRKAGGRKGRADVVEQRAGRRRRRAA